MKNFELITTNVSLATLKNAKLRNEAANFEKFAKAADIALGGVAYAARSIQLLFNGLSKGDSLDGYKTYVEFMDAYFGVKRAQAFNLAKAGSLLEPAKGKLQFIDKFSKAANSENCFSNTAIIRIAEWINRDKNPNANESDVVALIENGVIKQNMSIKQIESKLADFAGGKIDRNGNALIDVNAKENNDESGENNDESGENGNSSESDTTPATPNKQEKMVNLPAMTLASAQALKCEMLQFTKVHGKDKLPMMCTFLEELSKNM